MIPSQIARGRRIVAGELQENAGELLQTAGEVPKLAGGTQETRREWVKNAAEY